MATSFFFFLQIGHMGPTHILEAIANSSHAGSCLGALSASGMMGDSFFEDQGHQSLYPLSHKQNASLIITVWSGSTHSCDNNEQTQSASHSAAPP